MCPDYNYESKQYRTIHFLFLCYLSTITVGFVYTRVDLFETYLDIRTMEICTNTVPKPPRVEYATFPYQTFAVNTEGLAFCVGENDGEIYCAYLGSKFNGKVSNGGLGSVAKRNSKWFRVRYPNHNGSNEETSKVQYLSFNASGTALICMSTGFIFVIYVNYHTQIITKLKNKGNGDGESLDFNRSVCRSRIGEEYIFATFHPLKDTTIVALTSSSIQGNGHAITTITNNNNNSKNSRNNHGNTSNIILYDVSNSIKDLIITKELPFQTQSHPTSFTFPQFSTTRVGFGCWELFTIYILFQDGHIAPICPVVPDGAEISGETMKYLWESLSSVKQNDTKARRMLDDEIENDKFAELWLKESWVDQNGNGESFIYIENYDNNAQFTPMIQTPLTFRSNLNSGVEDGARYATSLSCVNMTIVTSTVHVPTIFNVIYKSGLIHTFIGPIASPKPRWKNIRADKYLNDNQRKHLLLLQRAKITNQDGGDFSDYFFSNASGRSDMSFIVGKKSVYLIKMAWLQLLQDYFSADSKNENKTSRLDFNGWKSEFSLIYYNSNNGDNNSGGRSMYGLQSIVTRRGLRKTFFRLNQSILDVDISAFLFLNSNNRNNNNMDSFATSGASKSLVSSIPDEMRYSKDVDQKLNASKQDPWPKLMGPINSIDSAKNAIIALNKMKQRIEALLNIQSEVEIKKKIWEPLVHTEGKLIKELNDEVAALSHVVKKIDNRCQRIKTSQIALNAKMEKIFTILHASKPISGAERQHYVELQQFKTNLNGFKITLEQLDNTVIRITSLSNDLAKRSNKFLNDNGNKNNVFIPRRMEQELVNALEMNAKLLANCKRNTTELRQSIENIGISIEAANLNTRRSNSSSSSINNGVKEGKEKPSMMSTSTATSSSFSRHNDNNGESISYDVGW